jgi:hypothetical protein
MVIWLYVEGLGPIITYTATVWWRKTEQTTVRTKLKSLQRLACFGTMVSMKIKTTAAMETILNLTKLDIYIYIYIYIYMVRLKSSRTVSKNKKFKLEKNYYPSAQNSPLVYQYTICNARAMIGSFS